MDGSTFTFTAPRIEMLAASVRRFPLTILAAIVYSLLSILSIHKVIDLSDITIILYGCFASFFVLLAVELVAEARGWNFRKRVAVCALAVLAVVSWCGMTGSVMGLPHWLLGCALFIFCVAAPAFGGASNDELWQFNQQTFLGLAIAASATGLLLAGVGAILYALSTLFGLKSDGEWFMTCAVVACSLFWPLYTMTFMPRLPQQLKDTPMMPGPLAFVLSFVALPVLLVYGALIGAYGIAVLGLSSTPVASVAWMVMAFSASGIALHFLLYPMRASGNMLVRWFSRYFFIILIPMLGLLFWAVLVRVGAYGVTENRYMALLGGFWAIGIALSAVVRRGEPGLGNAPAVLALLLVIASLGPWSAENISYRSQDMRLKQVLHDLGIMQGEQLVEPADRPQAGWDLRSNISSLLDYFRDRRDGRMPEYLVQFKNIDLMNSDGWADAVMRKWQMRYIDRWRRGREDMTEGSDTLSFNAVDAVNSGNNTPIPVTGYDWMLPFDAARSQKTRIVLGQSGARAVEVSITGSELALALGEASASVDVLSLMPQPLDEQGSYISKPMLVSDISLGASRVHLMIARAYLERLGGEWRISNLSGYLLLKE